MAALGINGLGSASVAPRSDGADPPPPQAVGEAPLPRGVGLDSPAPPSPAPPAPDDTDDLSRVLVKARRWAPNPLWEGVAGGTLGALSSPLVGRQPNSLLWGLPGREGASPGDLAEPPLVLVLRVPTTQHALAQGRQTQVHACGCPSPCSGQGGLRGLSAEQAAGYWVLRALSQVLCTVSWVPSAGC